MSNKKQSSVEYLVNIVQSCIAPNYIPKEIIEQAKAMHEEEIIKFAEDWEKSNLDCKEDLYNETFNADEA